VTTEAILHVPAGPGLASNPALYSAYC